MKVSIIIPVKEDNNNLRECISNCLALDYPDFEILILPDKPITDSNGVRVIPTGDVTPPEKRNIGAKHSSGEILAFIDDDAYPKKNWLKNAVKNFEDEKVGAVGGPAVTPEADSPREKAGGLVYSSPLGGGNYTYRYIPQKSREIDDYPSCNFLVRKSVMDDLSGFTTNFWPGEDTAFCLELTKKLGKKIIYDPEVFIYHHRRPLFIPHLKQVIRYALHRGYFVKRLPQTSLRLSYFLPAFLVIGFLTGGLLSLIFPALLPIYVASIAVYLFLIFLSSLFSSLNSNAKLIPLVFTGTVATHISYGLWFIKGLFLGKLKEEK